ncbi:hypothetical protein N7520_011060 [Penicillium odoratum]|uniref:uncharacterized protein n=1 Tax=Penicillium odoratum TaxID=1167516 RepID=UPI0025489B35|nr:uncharacterized protein N7520_011060 [Penicillium odoratum]KAJ5745878.1 hypothetical protein N7520_011060 [Penicillium odoratum]
MDMTNPNHFASLKSARGMIQQEKYGSIRLETGATNSLQPPLPNLKLDWQKRRVDLYTEAVKIGGCQDLEGYGLKIGGGSAP